MWLLETATAKLHRFHSPEDVPSPSYAILSHVWGENEQDFQEVKAIGQRWTWPRKNPRDEVCEKIRRCCEIAEKMGYKWVWIDTCCIDKTSSAELSEAINSMFRYYTLSAVCIVYLDDVEDVSDLQPYFRCRWKTRGWTLQELIAPAVVIFLSRSWTYVGSKHSLAAELERDTRIPVSLLMHKSRLSDYSVARRMSWAASRVTTRVEDEAYCLLGIFDINMPTLYGEGRRAFQRLQEEIMKTRLDTTLFAWGAGYSAETETREDETESFPLLAHAPRDFGHCSAVICSPRSKGGPEDGMSFKMTPHGIRARVPLLVIKEKTFIDLACMDKDYPIFLRVEQTDKSGVYSVVSSNSDFRRYRGHSDQALPSGKMAKIYLTNDTSGPDLPHAIGFPCNTNPHAPFQFSFTVSQVNPKGRREIKTRVAVQNVEESWKGTPPAVIQISGYFPVVSVICGICTTQTPFIGSLPEPPSCIHWAYTLDSFPLPRHSFPDEHDCKKDHIADWPDGKKVFSCSEGEGGNIWSWGVELSFVESKTCLNALRLCSVTFFSDF